MNLKMKKYKKKRNKLINESLNLRKYRIKRNKLSNETLIRQGINSLMT